MAKISLFSSGFSFSCHIDYLEITAYFMPKQRQLLYFPSKFQCLFSLCLLIENQFRTIASSGPFIAFLLGSSTLYDFSIHLRYDPSFTLGSFHYYIFCKFLFVETFHLIRMCYFVILQTFLTSDRNFIFFFYYNPMLPVTHSELGSTILQEYPLNIGLMQVITVATN